MQEEEQVGDCAVHKFSGRAFEGQRRALKSAWFRTADLEEVVGQS